MSRPLLYIVEEQRLLQDVEPDGGVWVDVSSREREAIRGINKSGGARKYLWGRRHVV